MASVDRIQHCSHWGAYTLLVKANEIVGIEPFEFDPAPSPMIHSVKKWANPEYRVLRPMVRQSWLRNRDKRSQRSRGDDDFLAIDWDEATTLVADEIRRVSLEYGNSSIFAGSYGWTSCGRFHHASTHLKRLLSLVGGYTGHVDTYSIAAGPSILRHVLGSDESCDGVANTFDTIVEHSEVLLVFGALSPRTSQVDAGGIGRHTLEATLRKLKVRNIEVVHISPSRDDLPNWIGAQWWPIRPNTDSALMLGLAGEILQNGWQDQVFLDRYCSGWHVLSDYLSGAEDGEVKNAEWAASITGILPEQIKDLAQKLTKLRTMITVSWSLQRAHHGEQPFWAALALSAISGQIGLPGGGVGYGYGSLAGFGAGFSRGGSPKINKPINPIDSFIPVARISDMLTHPGKTFSYEGRDFHYPEIKLIYWAGGNPFHHHQDLKRLENAWENPQTVIVQDPYWTATAKRADIILPATTSIERNDLAANKRSDFIIAMKQAIRPLGEARSDFEIFNQLAVQMGVGQAFNENRDEMAWLEQIYESSRVEQTHRYNQEMPDFAEFWRQGYARIELTHDYTHLSKFRADPDAYPLSTESGRIVLGSSTLAVLDLADCPKTPQWIEPAEWMGNAAEAQMHLISRQPSDRLHSQFFATEGDLRSKREYVMINCEDASKRSIQNGDIVRIWNGRGATLAVANITDDVRPGVLILPTGAWYSPNGDNGLDIAGNPNVLTLDIPSSSFSQGCSAHTCLVYLELHFTSSS